jgi:hypothetical protein
LIRVFISHKKEDELGALRLQMQLLAHNGVTAYLDVVDEHLKDNSEDLTEYLRGALSGCTHLMAAVSQRTRVSWWVPFEIGLATEKNYPISTYALGNVDLPDYLKKWPYLRTREDVDRYVRVARSTSPELIRKDLRKAAGLDRAQYAAAFHSQLRRALGQDR